MVKKSSYANRGMKLEKLIDETNKHYKKYGIADIRKVPTPIKIISNVRGKITGFPTNGEWVDYVGVSYDKTLVFDGKETSSDTSFPLSNIHNHQYELLESWDYYGAECFLIVNFTGLKRYFYLPFSYLKFSWERMNNGGRKSIPLLEFENNAKEIHMVGKILDYLNKT